MIIENLQFIIKLCLKKPAQCQYLWRWFKSLPDNYLIENQLPWLVFAAIDFLELVSAKFSVRHFDKIPKSLVVKAF
jgi:hypothetical protein